MDTRRKLAQIDKYRKEAEDKIKQETQKKEAEERQRIAAIKVSGTFNLKLGEAGHPAVVVLNDDDAWHEAVARDAEFLKKPCLVKKTNTFES